MQASDIRKKFIAFFESKSHKHLPSSSLIPSEDTTVLLTTAGMQQMMPFFIGAKTPPAQRMVTAQKCFRTNDIDEVGDSTHCTFFEMLGNFSVGDYFKKEVIGFAFEFLTKELGIPAEKLWVTIHPTEDVADKEWEKQGIPASRIFVDETNFWGPPGESGPCGPDSEIYYDFGHNPNCDNKECSPLCECGRFIEIWNLVFMEFFQDKDGSRKPLPAKNIDTGMGFERITGVIQGAESIYDTDIFTPIIHAIVATVIPPELTNTDDFTTPAGEIDYNKVVEILVKQDKSTHKSVRIIADHARAATFLAGDGVTPSSIGRGYVMRRIIRRAIRSGYLLQGTDLKGPFLSPIIDTVITQYAEPYPNLKKDQEEIKRTILEEEKNFFKTLERGIKLFNELMIASKQKSIPGDEVFKLYDTFGFPVELTREIAAENHFSLDEKGFERAMDEQRERSRRGSQFSVQSDTAIFQELAQKFGETKFIGYDTLESPATIEALLINKEEVTEAHKDQEIEIILDTTPFYARSGGQSGDIGTIYTESGKVEITDTRTAGGLTVHIGRVIDGVIKIKDTIDAQVEKSARDKTSRHHTGTHLLHQALRDVLGASVKQAGSSVSPKQLRFDFSFPRKLTPEELQQIETIMNEKITQKLPVEVHNTTIQDAKEQGAMALFDGKIRR
ncbi:MAG: alanine--tRNA ligase [bacterium]